MFLAESFSDDHSDFVEVFAACCLIDADAEMLLVDDTEVHAVFLSRFLHFACASAFRQLEQQCVEEVFVELFHAVFLQLLCEFSGEAVDMMCDFLYSILSVIDCVES